MPFQLSKDELNWISLLLEKTGVMAKDCIIENDSIIFLLNKGDTGRVIGKRGAIIKQLCQDFGKEVQVIEYSDKLTDLAINTLNPVRPVAIALDNKNGKQTVIVTVTNKDRPRAIGKNGVILKRSRAILKRHFAIDNVFINVDNKSDYRKHQRSN